MSLRCGAVCGGGVQKGTMSSAQLSAIFQSLPLLPTNKLGPSGADSQVCGLVYFLGPCGSLLRTLLCEAGSFFWCHNVHRFFQSEVLRLYLPAVLPWVAWSVLFASCSSWFIHMQMWNCPLCQLLPPLVHQLTLCPPLAAALPRILSTPVTCFLPSYWSGRMFLANPFYPAKFSFEKSADSLMGTPL